MEKSSLLLVLVLLSACQAVPPGGGSMAYEPDVQYPFGRPNPDAPAQLSQFHFIVGRNDCSEQRLDSATGEWVEGLRSWNGHYFMNGLAIRDGGRSGATTNSNVRIFDEATGEWVVSFFSLPGNSTGTWRGKMEGANIVLRRPQKAPGTDFDGFSTLTFSNLSSEGFDWLGAWVSEDGSLEFPFWRVQCQKVEA